MIKLVRSLGDVLVPWQCLGCPARPRDRFFCSRCALALAKPDPRMLASLCPTFQPGPRTVTAMWYTEPGSPARAALHAIKYGFAPSLAWWCGREAAELVPRSLRVEALVPVPLHPTRFAERGFNQAEQIAIGACAALDVPVVPVLRRRLPRISQTRGQGDVRREMPVETFAASGAVPARILLVDDVATTGSTLNAAARALLEAGCRRVDALVIAVSRRPGRP